MNGDLDDEEEKELTALVTLRQLLKITQSIPTSRLLPTQLPKGDRVGRMMTLTGP